MSETTDNTTISGAAATVSADTESDGPSLTGNAETNPPPDSTAFFGVTTDGSTIQGNGTGGNPIRVKEIFHDGTMTGKGTAADPLSASGTSVDSDGVTLQGDGTPGDKLAIKAVQHDGSMTGNGTVASPLSVPDATVDSDGVTLEGDGSPGSKLAIKAVQHDATMTGNGTVASPLTVVDVDAVIFDGATNIRSDRPINQSPIDNTKTQITNLGSQDGVNDPTATGATGMASTIGGGDDNSASGDYSTIPGGAGNVASGFLSHAEGSFCYATAYAAKAEGDSTLASGLGSHSEGTVTQATGDYAHAQGERSIAGGRAAHAEGRVNSATGKGAHAEGYRFNGDPSGFPNCQATGDGSHAEGSDCTASGKGSHAEGAGNTASGEGSHAEGGGFGGGAYLPNTASGDGSHARGLGSTASGRASTAAGIGGQAIRESQEAYSSGNNAGESQTSKLVLRGLTSGAAAAQTVELAYGYGGALKLELEDNKAYLIRVSCVAGGVQAGPTRVARAFTLEFVVRRAAGVSTIVGSLSGTSAGDATTADWTLVASVGAAPDRVKFAFTTGAIASACFVAAKVEFTEVLF